MKKLAIIVFGFLSFKTFSQFNVTVNTNPKFSATEAYFYTVDGSKNILVNKVTKKNNQWTLKYPKPYSGMMKVYFPEINYSLNFISENKNVEIKISGENQSVKDIDFIDDANKTMSDVENVLRNKDNLLPVLYQIKELYSSSSDFYKAIETEIINLSNFQKDYSQYPFITYFSTTSDRFLSEKKGKPKASKDEMIKFISNSNQYLESSNLMRPILISYLNVAGEEREKAIDELLNAVNLESTRGQTVLSELIDLFDTYAMNDLKDKYLAKAQNLKCAINERLTSTIEINKKTAIGATFENYTFVSPVNTKAKSLYDIKTDKKVIVFWSSGCSHCEKELPKFIPVYNQMKSKGIEIVGFSLDVNQQDFLAKANSYPWINDSELRGWHSNSAEKYNVKATPTFFILDKNNKILAKPDRLNEVLSYFDIK